jgi:heat shock protein HtpX
VVNVLKVWMLMAVLTGLLVLLGRAIGGESGALIFLLIALGMNFFGYYYSDKIAIKMTRSRPVSESEAPELYAMVRRLCQSARLPMPKLYITPSLQPNAFATGRNPQNSAVAVTEGLMKLLNRTELEGVLAHELAHIKNRDVLVGTIAATLAGAITMIASVIQWGAILGLNRDEEDGLGSMVGAIALAIVAPIAAMLIQMAVSRSREYMADAAGARMAGNSEGLANALLKLERGARAVPMQVNPAASHLFIVNPLSGGAVVNLFSTHPPIADRVQKLRSLRV